MLTLDMVFDQVISVLWLAVLRSFPAEIMKFLLLFFQSQFNYYAYLKLNEERCS